MLISTLLSAALVLLTVGVHFEALRLLSGVVGQARLGNRATMIGIVIGAFLAHTVEVWLYALGYLLLGQILDHDIFGGEFGYALADYVYFSAVTYTSLGIGDVYPLGGVRLMSGIEALNGLVLIGWSASFTYLAMERLWSIDGRTWTDGWRR